MFKRRLPDEVRQSLIFIAVAVLLPIIVYFLDKYFNAESAIYKPAKPRDLSVIVSDAEKKEALSKIPPASVVKTVREAMKQQNNSTVHVQLNRAPANSQEQGELRALLESEAKLKKRPSIKKEKSTPESPIRYFDESTPRDKSADALYLYIVEVAGLWPRFCIQSVGKQPLNIKGFKIIADGKTFNIGAGGLKTEKSPGKVVEYLDMPLDHQSFMAVQALIKARKATLISIGSSGENSREITEKEKKGLARIVETYTALGGTFSFIKGS